MAVEGKLDVAGGRLGRYELLTRLAAGGMAEVFIARVKGEGGFERLVAVKRMLPTIAEEEHFAEMFLDEGRIAGLIDSPNVVQILDVGRAESGELFIAMELVRGLPLHRLLTVLARAHEHLPVSIATSILIQAAEGLSAAHTATTPLGDPLGIVHRDVSPQNLLVGVDGRVRVADFGVARAVHRRTSTSTGELKGKLAYFAPEQLRSQPATAASDVFALGIVAWEALAMRRLFQGDNPIDTIERIRSHVPAPLDGLRQDVPPALARAIERALSKDAGARTQSAALFAHELREAAPPADPSALAAFVRSWGDTELRAVEERIKLALAGKLDATSQDIVLPETDRSGIRPAEDELATTVTPSRPTVGAALSAPAPAPVVPSVPAVAAAPPRATPPWVWLAAGTVAIAAVSGLALVFLTPAAPEVEVMTLPVAPTAPATPPPPVVVVEAPPAAIVPTPVVETPVALPEPATEASSSPALTGRRHGHGDRRAGETAETETVAVRETPPAEHDEPRREEPRREEPRATETTTTSSTAATSGRSGGLRGLDSFRTDLGEH